MTTRRISVALFTAMALLLSAAVSLAAQQDAADLEILKGTVSKVADKTLHLKGTTFPDVTLGKRDVTFLIEQGDLLLRRGEEGEQGRTSAGAPRPRQMHDGREGQEGGPRAHHRG